MVRIQNSLAEAGAGDPARRRKQLRKAVEQLRRHQQREEEGGQDGIDAEIRQAEVELGLERQQAEQVVGAVVGTRRPGERLEDLLGGSGGTARILCIELADLSQLKPRPEGRGVEAGQGAGQGPGLALQPGDRLLELAGVDTLRDRSFIYY